ncbi:MAG: YaiO family outer membrane beta-barrel protein [Candidatus Aminicenantes bacterium]|nr:YaiO family outer membrane beta-barrel protein [Candidatus Aminicenantes bacterium]
MKKKSKRERFQLFALLVLGGWCIAAGQEPVQEKAAAAIRAGDYETAIRLCHDGLRKNHLDYELNFLLSRALAFSGRWDEALHVLSDLALAHPENTDILLFRARVESWEKDYAEAEKGYTEVLRLSPDNSDALIGLAEIASWQEDFASALSIYEQIRRRNPPSADIYFRIGRIYLWEGNFAQAEAHFREAHRLAPENDEYGRALQKAKPRLLDKFELRYEHQTDSFSDARNRYLDQNLALQMNISKNTGPLVLKFNHTQRFGRNDDRCGLEFYPRLWKRSYGYTDLAFSPKAVYYPKASYLFEVYQGVFAAAEISLGYRGMDFDSEHVDQFLGSLGYYFGNYYALWRWYYSRENSGDRLAWLANIRRYFSAENFIFLGCGRGTRPEDFVTLEDVRADQSWVFLAGFNWYFWKQIKLQVYYSLEDEQALRRQTLFVSTGYRW